MFKNCAKGEQRNKVPQSSLALKYMLELSVNNIDACSHSANIDVITNNSLHMCTSTMAVVSELCGERALVTCKILVCAELVHVLCEIMPYVKLPGSLLLLTMEILPRSN